MSRQIQIRRGTAAENNAFTGAIGEVTMDTTNKTLRVHDGATAGGTVLAKKSEIPDLTNMDYVIESQLPTADNNYTWYRKYKSGWIEQGGLVSTASGSYSVTFPVTMSDLNYNIFKTMITNSSNEGICYNQTAFYNKTTTSATTGSAGVGFSWVVYGIAA